MNEAETGFSSRVLAGPLSIVLGLLGLVLLGSWIPQYLSWPYWADHDVFASAALAWDQGEQPYRDVRLNNFPGTVYVFYALGKLVGWGRPWSFYAFDAVLVTVLAAFLPFWSRRVFGRYLPGLIGSLVFLKYYESLEYWLAAQRDWQSPFFAVLGLMIVQAWPGRAGRVVSAGLVAIALSIRPQAVLFLPALLSVVMSGREGGGWRSKFSQGAIWLVMLSAFSVLWLVPLLVNGIFGDFIRSIKMVAYGSTYNRVIPAYLGLAWLFQPGLSRWMVVSVAIIWLAMKQEPAVWKRSMPWLLALGGATIYKPVSPLPHIYLEIPMAVVGSVAIAVLADLILGWNELASKFKLVGLVVLLALGASPTWPDTGWIGPNLRAVQALRSGVEPAEAPSGYRPGTMRFGEFYSHSAGFYPWNDYRATLLYLRSQTQPTTRIANVLKGVPAIVSEVGRPSALPAESIAWLLMVNIEDETAFVKSIEAANDSVVVWSPGEVGPVPKFKVERIEAAIRRYYQFEARFGVIEVWRRRSEPLPP